MRISDWSSDVCSSDLGVRLGAQGAISGLANICPQALMPSVVSGVEDPRIIRLVEELLRFPVTPAVKALVAHHHRAPAWLTARTPLVALDLGGAEHMARAYDALFAAAAIGRAPGRDRVGQSGW